MATFPHQLKLLGVIDRCRVANMASQCRVANMVSESEVSSSNHGRRDLSK
jgi:hypothetical protein